MVLYASLLSRAVPCSAARENSSRRRIAGEGRLGNQSFSVLMHVVYRSHVVSLQCRPTHTSLPFFPRWVACSRPVDPQVIDLAVGVPHAAKPRTAGEHVGEGPHAARPPSILSVNVALDPDSLKLPTKFMNRGRRFFSLPIPIFPFHAHCTHLLRTLGLGRLDCWATCLVLRRSYKVRYP